MREKTQSKELIVFIDCGDTIVDESTQVFDAQGNVLRADPIPGADRMLEELYAEGYRIALVADGRVVSFHNILANLHMEHVFEVFVISEEIGAEKPDARMFEAAMERMGLCDGDRGRIVMIGNNVERDIVGANRQRLCSILLSYSPRYRMQPAGMEETPHYVAATPAEVGELVRMLNRQAARSESLGQGANHRP